MRAFYLTVLCIALWALTSQCGQLRAQLPDTSAPLDPNSGLPYDGMPRPPVQPMPVSRPVAWPGTPVESFATAPGEGQSMAPPVSYPNTPAAANSSNYGVPPPAAVQPYSPPGPAQVASAAAAPQTDLVAPNAAVLPAPQQFTEAEIVARVGTQVILAGDVKAMISEMLARQKVEVPKEREEEFYAQGRRQVLKQIIETKLIYNDAVHSIPAEGFAHMESKINEFFDQSQLPNLLQENGVANRQELDKKMSQRGGSLDRLRRGFFEKTVATQWLKQRVKLEEELPIAEVLSYYQRNSADYEFPAKARWEELMVRFDRFPSREAAFAALAEMGNQVMQGVPLAEIAKARSQGLTAAEGGLYDWTTKGSLVSKLLDEAVFTLPPGSLSQILETEQGFHIVRVLQRTDAGRTPFTDAQVEIKKRLKDERVNRQINEYIAEVRRKTPIWTIYDDQPGGLDGPKAEAE